MKLLQKLKNKPFCNELHFFLIGIIFLAITFKLWYFIFLLLLYIIFIIKKTKLVVPLLILFLILILNVFLFNIKTIKDNTNKKCYITNVNESYYDGYIDNCKIRLYEYGHSYKPGDLIYVTFEFQDISTKSYNTDFDYKEYLYSKRIKYQGKVLNSSIIKHIPTTKILKYKYTNYLADVLDENSYPYVMAIVFGDNNIDQELKEGYSTLGLSHILAISGLHIMILYNFISFILLKVFKYYKNTIPLIILCLYVFLFAFTISCIRALLFIIIKSLNKKSKIRYTKLDILSITFIIMLIYNPFIIYGTGFILSFLVSFIMIYMYDIIKEKNPLLKRYLSYLIIYFLTFPIICNFNNKLELFSVLFSPVISNVIALIIIPISFVLAVFPTLSIVLKYIFIGLNYYVLALAKSSIAFHLESFTLINAIIYYIFFIFLLIGFIKKRRRILYFSIFSIYMLVLLTIRFFNPYYKVTFIDVGQGDSCLIELPYDKGNVVIDAFNCYDFLKSRGIKRINYLILTHSDDDHILDKDKLLNYFEIDNIIYSKFDNGYGTLPNGAIGVESGYNFKLESIFFNILAPINQYNTKNLNSVVMKITINKYKFLFTGDMEIKEETDIISKYKEYLKSDVLKVGHHGSNTSTSIDFFNYVNPAYSIISVAENNKFGFPNEDVVERLNKTSKVYMTKDHGNITFYIKKDKMWISLYR